MSLKYQKMPESKGPHLVVNNELDNIFDRSPIDQNTGRIIGIDEQGMPCSTRKLTYANDNMAIITSPGCGMMWHMVLPHVFQSIRKGNSFVVTSSTDEVYGRTAELAKEAGYKIRIANFQCMEASDGFNILQMVDGPVKAGIIAGVILENSAREGENPFLKSVEEALLKSLILMVRFLPDYHDRMNLASICRMLTYESFSAIDLRLKSLERSTLAYPSAQSFLNCPEEIRESAYASLGLRLNILNSNCLLDVVSNDDIDFTPSGNEKYAYYIIAPMSPLFAYPHRFLCASFVTALILGVLRKEWSNTGSSQNTTQFILSDLESVGVIPILSALLAAAKDKGISAELIIEDVEHFKSMYKGTWGQVLNCCSWWVYAQKREDLSIINAFSKRAGTQTIYPGPFAPHRESKEQPVMSVSELRELSGDQLFVNILGHQSVVLKKYDFWNHPFFAESQTRICHAEDHEPAWL